MHGSERAVSATLAALHLRREQGESQHVVVALSEAAEAIALPVRHGMTGSSSPLGGASPFYGVYESSDGCIALGALETHFARSLATSLGVEADTDVRQQLDKIFREKTSQHWQDWAEKTNLPIMALKSIPENS